MGSKKFHPWQVLKDSRSCLHDVVWSPSRCKDYGILSVLFQLYTRPRINFKLPPTVFYPQPKVSSSL
jgi:hypothetical protein